MLGELTPTKWFSTSAASPSQPCQWEGWVDFGSAGRQWVVLYLMEG